MLHFTCLDQNPNIALTLSHRPAILRHPRRRSRAKESYLAMSATYAVNIHGAQASDLRMPWLVATSKRKPGTQGVSS